MSINADMEQNGKKINDGLYNCNKTKSSKYHPHKSGRKRKQKFIWKQQEGNRPQHNNNQHQNKQPKNNDLHKKWRINNNEGWKEFNARILEGKMKKGNKNPIIGRSWKSNQITRINCGKSKYKNRQNTKTLIRWNKGNKKGKKKSKNAIWTSMQSRK